MNDASFLVCFLLPAPYGYVVTYETEQSFYHSRQLMQNGFTRNTNDNHECAC